MERSSLTGERAGESEGRSPSVEIELRLGAVDTTAVEKRPDIDHRMERASVASEPRERSAPAKRRARERVGESEGRSPSVEIDVRRWSHEAMATVYEVYAVHADCTYAAQAAQAAFDLLDRLERELSRFLPNSDITRINHLDAGGSTRVAPSTLECLVIARHMFDLTGGAFDVSIGTGLPSLELDPDESVVRATTRGVRIDLGGIGKGYAVDLMAELLEEWEVPIALVHGGFSSMLALEPPAARPGWPLTLSDPVDPSRRLERLTVRQTALGASGVRKRDHIVDPRTGDPVRGRRAAWVTLPRPPGRAAAAVADALTTASMLLAPDEIDALCRNSPGLEAWILDDAGLLHFGRGNAAGESEGRSPSEKDGD